MTTRPTLSLILPTIGRESLEESLDGIAAAGICGVDELLVFADGEAQCPIVDRVLAHPIARKTKVRTFLMHDQGGHWGHPGRNRGMREASKDVVMFTQDDQRLVPGSLGVVREIMRADPLWQHKGHMFRVVPRHGGEMPRRDGETALGSIDADCIALPTVLRRHFSVWRLDYAGDHSFIVETKAALEAAGFGFAYHAALISVHETKLAYFPEMFQPAGDA